MSEKWADYLVSAVRYENNSTKERISNLEVRVDKGDTVAGSTTSWSKNEVIKSIESRNTFTTIFKNDSKWSKGSNVDVITVENTKFLRTDANKTKADNLGELPEF